MCSSKLGLSKLITSLKSDGGGLDVQSYIHRAKKRDVENHQTHKETRKQGNYNGHACLWY